MGNGNPLKNWESVFCMKRKTEPGESQLAISLLTHQEQWLAGIIEAVCAWERLILLASLLVKWCG